MKQLQTTHKKIGGYDFYIRPFPAFVSANISAELTKLITPLLGSLIPLVSGQNEKGEINIEDIDIDAALPAIASGLSTLSGDVVERMMRQLMVNYNNINVEDPETHETKPLDDDAVNEIFCMDLLGMYKLCWEVINLNFKGFFENLGLQFGGRLEVSALKKATQANTEPST